jgi:acyl carrier protein
VNTRPWQEARGVSDARDKLLNYINGELLNDPTRRANPDTPLFEDGWIDSLKILKLIAYVELMIGRNIPDDEIVMKNFRTVSMIVEHFASR